MKKIVAIARKLRHDLTDAEKYLWYCLQNKNLGGLKFRKQSPIGKYIVDFVCFEKKVVIEIDGGQHAANKAADAIRDEWLSSQGFKILRFWNNEIMQNRDAALQKILDATKIN